MSGIARLFVDVGDVLIPTLPDAQYTALATATDHSVEEVRARIEHDDLVRRFETGGIDALGFVAVVADRLGGGVTGSEVQAAWNQVLGTPSGLLSALLGVVSSSRITLASNTNPIHAREIVRRLGILELGIDTVFSHEIGSAKPSPAFFGTCAAGRTGGEFLFVDDKPENVDAAVRVGMHGHLHQDDEGTVAWVERMESGWSA